MEASDGEEIEDDEFAVDDSGPSSSESLPSPPDSDGEEEGRPEERPPPRAPRAPPGGLASLESAVGSERAAAAFGAVLAARAAGGRPERAAQRAWDAAGPLRALANKALVAFREGRPAEGLALAQLNYASSFREDGAGGVRARVLRWEEDAPPSAAELSVRCSASVASRVVRVTRFAEVAGDLLRPGWYSVYAELQSPEELQASLLAAVRGLAAA
jgi:hypothetical protein